MMLDKDKKLNFHFFSLFLFFEYEPANIVPGIENLVNFPPSLEISICNIPWGLAHTAQKTISYFST